MNRRFSLEASAWAAASILLSACAGLTVDRMIPPMTVEPAPRFAMTLHVMPVTGAEPQQFGGPALVSNEMYRDALVATLRKSNLFASVQTRQTADCELHAQIVAHGQGPTLTYRSAMVVQYRLVQSGTGAELWSQGFNSRHEVGVSQALAGARRTVEAQEGSVRDNLAQLIEALSKAELRR
jgi:hypothetical protein